MTITFEKIPAALQEMQTLLFELKNELQKIRANQPINETPITGVELRKRLQISRPTEIEMRKRGKLPYLMVNGHYRYLWQDVIKSINQ